MTAPRRSGPRTVLGVILWTVTGMLGALCVLVIVEAVSRRTGSGSDAAAGGGFVFVLAALAGTAAHAVTRGGHRDTSAATGPDPAGPAPAPPLLSSQGAQRARGARPEVGAAVRYRERGSQFPVLGTLVCGAIGAGCVAGLIAVGGPNGRAGAGGFFLLAGALIGVGYLLFALADLPNGVEIGAGRFVVGALGVPAAGRIWRRVSGALDSVQSWEVLSREQVRRLDAVRRAEARSGRRRIYLGDLRMFGRRQVLRLIIDPAAARARFPAHLQQGYVLLPAARAGAVWDGAVLIGTRRPAALAAALDQALPGRQAGTRRCGGTPGRDAPQ
jgi:hypothetical protein